MIDIWDKFYWIYFSKKSLVPLRVLVAKKLFLKKLLLENNHLKHTNVNRGVGNIEHGTEKYKLKTVKKATIQ